MTEQWQELKETIIELRDNDGTGSQHDVCKFLANLMDVLEKQMQEPKGKWIKIQSGDKDFPESIVCSRCKNENSHFDFDEHSEPIGKIFVTSKYCPNCGAKMESEG